MSAKIIAEDIRKHALKCGGPKQARVYPVELTSITTVGLKMANQMLTNGAGRESIRG